MRFVANAAPRWRGERPCVKDDEGKGMDSFVSRGHGMAGIGDPTGPSPDSRAGAARQRILRLSLLSDLHLAGREFAPPRTDADVVVLAGDIDDAVRGVEWANRAFDRPVVYVLGNHEYRGSTIDGRVAECRRAAAAHVHVLERSGVEIAGLRFLGATLWTDFSLRGAEEQAHHRAVATQRCADFRLIAAPDGRPYSVDQAAAIHQDTVAWLERELRDARPTVVVTHHAPSPRSVPERLSDAPLVATYATDLSILVGKAALWIHGHVHDSSDYEIAGARVLCNPRGGARAADTEEPMNPQFDKDMSVSLVLDGARTESMEA